MTGMRWNGWGSESAAVTLPASVTQLLAGLLAPGPRIEPVPEEQVRWSDRELPSAVRDALSAAVGPAHVHLDRSDRLRHTRGKSTVDLLRLRAGDALDAPDAVVRPGSHDEVLAVLRLCSTVGVAVVPFGGGTSVVGGLTVAGPAAVISLDLGRLDQVSSVDLDSGLAVLQAGLTGPEAERQLAEHGVTLGHYPQSYEFATIGGYAATRSSGQYSMAYGRFDDIVLALRVATPIGTVDAGRAPRSAAGPDLRQLFLGSEGALGVITEVTAQVRPVPTERIREAWRFESFDDGLRALRRLAQRGPRPTMARLSDETETAVNGLLEGHADGNGALVMVAFEDAAAIRDQDGVRAKLQEDGGRRLAEDRSAGWSQSRFRAPYLRDALLDAGVFVETLETATFWSGLPRLRETVQQTLAEHLPSPLILSHVSHVYPAGAALYFTVVCGQSEEIIAQWTAAKDAVSQAIVAAGGTVTHHHGVGRDHAAALAEEIGPLGVAALRAVKATLDPAGILNPGVLLG